MKKVIIMLFGFLLLASCGSDDNKRNAIEKHHEGKSLVLQLDAGQVKEAALTESLVELYLNLFKAVDVQLKENQAIIDVEFVVALDKVSNTLSIEELKYYTKDDLADVFAAAYMEALNDEHAISDLNAPCEGGTLDENRNSIKESLGGARALAQWSEECFKDGAESTVSKASLAISFVG